MKLAGIDLAPLIDSVKAIRDGVAILPKLAETLDSIERLTAEMTREVGTMRRGVDALGEEVRGMRGTLEPLEGRLIEVAGAIDRLEPQLEQVVLALHPLRRAGGRLRRGGQNGEPDGAEAAPVDQTSSGEKVSQDDGSADS